MDRQKREVLTTYRADTEDAEKGVARLSEAEKRRAGEFKKLSGEMGRSWDATIAKYAKVTAGIAAVAAAYEGLKAAVAGYEERQRLVLATQGAEIRKLREVTRGLASDMDLMRFAVEAQTGSMRLSGDQMETALKAALALEAQGRPLALSMERIGQAVREGSVESLKELGIVVTGGGASGTREGLQSVMAALSETASSAGDNFEIAGEDIRRATTKAQNSIDSLKESFGRLVENLAPLIERLSQFVGLLSDVVDMATFLQETLSGEGQLAAGRSADRAVARAEAEMRRINEERNRRAMDQEDPEFERRFRQATGGSLLATADEDIEISAIRGGRGRRGLGRLMDTDPADIEMEGDAELSLQMKLLEARIAMKAAADEQRAADQLAYEERLARDHEIIRNAHAMAEAAAPLMEAAKNEALLTLVFGSYEEVNLMAEAFGSLSTSFGGFVEAFGTGVDALITGQMGFVEAFTSSIAELGRSMAVEFAMKALKHSLYAAGAFALGDPRAGAHLKAAAGFAAGATALGALARGLGAGGGPAAYARPPTAGAAGVAVPSGVTAGGSSTTFQLIGGEFVDLPEAQRRAIFRDKMRRVGVTVPGDAFIDG